MYFLLTSLLKAGIWLLPLQNEGDRPAQGLSVEMVGFYDCLHTSHWSIDSPSPHTVRFQQRNGRVLRSLDGSCVKSPPPFPDPE